MRMNLSEYYGSKFDEDLVEFIDEIYKIVVAKVVSL